MIDVEPGAEPASAIRLRAAVVTAAEPYSVVDIEPANGKVLARLVGGGAIDATRAVDSAAEAYDGWRLAPAKQRARSLRGIATDLREQPTAEALSVLITRETGKRLAESRAEVELSAAFFEWFADAISDRAAEIWSVVPGVRHEVSQRPLGVIAAITPWNFPVSIPARKIAPALAAGCTVVFKPSDTAPLSALRLSEIIDRHVPSGALNTLLGPSRILASTWLADSRVRGLTFTGSTEVGQALAGLASERLVRCVLELGGNAPFVVLDDADLDQAVKGMAAAKFRNNGQSCIAASQVWVPRSHLDNFMSAAATTIAAMVLGDPLQASTSLGPLALPSDPGRIGELVEDAEIAGARVVRSQLELPSVGHFAAPAICIDAPTGARISREEIFGPLISVRTYGEIDEVIAAVRADAHGLGGYVSGRDLDRATTVARALDVGIVGVNTATPNTPQVPFAGLKFSGLGTEGGQGGLDEFLTYQTVAITRH